MEMDSMYHVGDKVLVTGVNNCSHGKNEEMEDLVGQIVTIRKVFWDRTKELYCYYIREDSGWTWDDSCFDNPIQDLPVPDISTADITYLLSQ